jgi:hypothetical protein
VAALQIRRGHAAQQLLLSDSGLTATRVSEREVVHCCYAVTRLRRCTGHATCCMCDSIKMPCTASNEMSLTYVY